MDIGCSWLSYGSKMCIQMGSIDLDREESSMRFEKLNPQIYSHSSMINGKEFLFGITIKLKLIGSII